jgi:hypothetical protein
MGFLGLGRPRWKHADAEVRLRALADLDASQQGVFRDLALRDPEPRVRAVAAGRVSGLSDLTRLAREGDDAVRRIARERSSGFADQLLRAKPFSEVGELLSQIDDQKSLAELSVQASDQQVRAAAFARLLALPEPSEPLLALVAIQDATGTIAAQAVARIGKRSVLKDVVRKAKVDAVRTAAAARSEALAAEAEKPSAERRRQARLKTAEALLPQALKLAVSSDHARSPEAWSALCAQWDSALAAEADLPHEDALSELDRRFRRAHQDADERRTAWVAQIAAARAQGEAVLAQLVEGVDAFEIAARFAPDAAVAGSCVDLFDAIRARVATLTAVQATSEPAAPALDPEVAARLITISTEAEALAAAAQFEAKFRFQALHKEWSKLAADLPADDDLAHRFPAAYAAWKARRKEEREERTNERATRLTELERLASIAEDLAAKAAALDPADHEAVRAHESALKDVQSRWRAVGPVPANQVATVRGRYRAALDAAWMPVGATREAEDWDRFTRLAHAEELIASVEALTSSEDWPHIAHQVKEAHRQWKALGALPRDRGQDAWLRFKSACDAQFDRCRPFFAEQDGQRLKNLEAKQALIAELETICNQSPVGLAGSPADIATSKAAGERVKAIQAEWKAIGMVPREQDRAVWDAFRALCDRFFASRRAAFDARHEEQVENLNRKIALCLEAEDLATAVEAGLADPSQARPPADVSRSAKDLQAAWKNLGHVPRERADEMWNRWRTANDRIYAGLKPFFAEQDAVRQANAAAKEKVIAEIEALATHENPHWFKDDVREAQEQWRTIGHVPRERMDELNQRFHAACTRILDAQPAPT